MYATVSVEYVPFSAVTAAVTKYTQHATAAHVRLSANVCLHTLKCQLSDVTISWNFCLYSPLAIAQPIYAACIQQYDPGDCNIHMIKVAVQAYPESYYSCLPGVTAGLSESTIQDHDLHDLV